MISILVLYIASLHAQIGGGIPVFGSPQGSAAAVSVKYIPLVLRTGTPLILRTGTAFVVGH